MKNEKSKKPRSEVRVVTLKLERPSSVLSVFVDTEDGARSAEGFGLRGIERDSEAVVGEGERLKPVCVPVVHRLKMKLCSDRGEPRTVMEITSITLNLNLGSRKNPTKIES